MSRECSGGIDNKKMKAKLLKKLLPCVRMYRALERMERELRWEDIVRINNKYRRK